MKTDNPNVIGIKHMAFGVRDAEKALAFGKAFSELNRRIMAFSALPVDQLDRLALQRSVDHIGRDQA